MRFAALVLMACTGFTGCKTSQRANVAPNDPITIKVKMHGQDPAVMEQYKLVVQLALCGDATGVKSADGTYGFSVAGIQKDAVCQIRVVGPNSSTAGVHFFTGEDGLYFTDTRLIIKQDADGALVGDAFLQKLFSTQINTTPGTSTWSFDVPVKAPAPFTEVCTCIVDCAPDIANNAAAVAKGSAPGEGTCSFVNVAKTDTTAVECKKITVQCGATFYAAEWSPAAKIDATSGKKTTLPSTTLLPGVPTTDGDVAIDVQIVKPSSGH